MKLRNADMIISGHTHNPEIDGRYINCGDWVDHCTAVIEHLDGRIELIRYEIK
jgi:UDP-2,3-diacylglucosamine pyrophosphatase LpxH